MKQIDNTKDEVEIPNMCSQYSKQRFSHKSKMIKKTKAGRTIKSSVNKKHLEDKISYDKEALRTELQSFDFVNGTIA